MRSVILSLVLIFASLVSPMEVAQPSDCPSIDAAYMQSLDVPNADDSKALRGVFDTVFLKREQVAGEPGICVYLVLVRAASKLGPYALFIAKTSTDTGSSGTLKDLTDYQTLKKISNMKKLLFYMGIHYEPQFLPSGDRSGKFGGLYQRFWYIVYAWHQQDTDFPRYVGKLKVPDCIEVLVQRGLIHQALKFDEGRGALPENESLHAQIVGNNMITNGKSLAFLVRGVYTKRNVDDMRSSLDFWNEAKKVTAEVLPAKQCGFSEADLDSVFKAIKEGDLQRGREEEARIRKRAKVREALALRVKSEEEAKANNCPPLSALEEAIHTLEWTGGYPFPGALMIPIAKLNFLFSERLEEACIYRMDIDLSDGVALPVVIQILPTPDIAPINWLPSSPGSLGVGVSAGVRGIARQHWYFQTADSWESERKLIELK